MLVVIFNEAESCKSRLLALLTPIESPEPNSMVTWALGIKRNTPEVALSIVWFPAPLANEIPAIFEVASLLKSTCALLSTTTLPEARISAKLLELLLFAVNTVDPLLKLTLFAWIKAELVIFESVKFPCNLFSPSKLTLTLGYEEAVELLSNCPESLVVVTPLKVNVLSLEVALLNQNGPYPLVVWRFRSFKMTFQLRVGLLAFGS